MDTLALRLPRSTEEVRASYARLRAQRPQLRVREAAQALGVAEAELVAADGATPLRPDWAELLNALPGLGRVMALTRNEACVHERIGRYEQVEVNGGMGLVLGAEIDLRLFLRRWAFGFACAQPLHSGLRLSLQFFDAQGEAIQKIYLTEESDADAYRALVERFRAPPQALVLQAAPARTPPLPDAQIDVPALRRDWEALRDTHDFHGMLARHRVARTQALRLAGMPLAQRVGNGAIKQILDVAAATQEPIMVFVGNPGCLQIHTGPVTRIACKNEWLNVLDQDFNLHLREDLVAECWVVRKPTEDGVVTALEVYDGAGALILQLFGKRKPGQAEAVSWRQIVAAVEVEQAERSDAPA